MFDWRSFLKAHRIPYVEHGPNVARNHINIKCPWCGRGDPSHHMGLCLDKTNPAWGCWRDTTHRGKSPIRLIQKLLGINSFMAAQEAEKFGHTSDKPLLDPTHEITLSKPKALELPNFFFPVHDGKDYSHLFWQYLCTQRNFDNPNWLLTVCNYYRLRYCLLGDWSMRLIVPIYQGGRLVNWTGRTLKPAEQEPLRYRTLPNERCLLSVKDTIFDYDNVAMGGENLIICEGPFDAMKLNRPPMVRSTCLFGNVLSKAQLASLVPLLDRYQRVFVILDREAKKNAIELVGELSAFHRSVQQIDLPQQFKDPGEMGFNATVELLGKLAHGNQKTTAGRS